MHFEACGSFARDKVNRQEQAHSAQQPVLSVEEPHALAIPFVFSSPHSGSHYPLSFLKQSRLNPAVLRRSEDMHVDDLIQPATRLGAPLIKAHFPRCYVDVNREPLELDPRMFEGRLPAQANTRSLRVAGGLGTIPKVVSDHLDIYDRRLPVSEALDRINRCYKPYHATLRQLIDRTHRRFGVAVLIDCHSMPQASLDKEGHIPADFVIGDRFGTSAAPLLVAVLEEKARSLGYRVARNRPYAGGFITEHFGSPESGRHAVQIEINRSLYMNEVTGQKTTGYAALREDLFNIMTALAGVSVFEIQPWRRAAE
jgi:N-formylglutamate amidohydrolase